MIEELQNEITRRDATPNKSTIQEYDSNECVDERLPLFLTCYDENGSYCDTIINGVQCHLRNNGLQRCTHNVNVDEPGSHCGEGYGCDCICKLCNSALWRERYVKAAMSTPNVATNPRTEVALSADDRITPVDRMLAILGNPPSAAFTTGTPPGVSEARSVALPLL